MKIGILVCGRPPEELRERHGEYDGMFERFLDGRGFTFDSYAALDGEIPADVHAAEGWLITGSRYGVYEDHDWIPPLEDFLRRAYARSVPIVGICFGHQILAQALGGKVEKFSGGWSVGGETYDLDGLGPTMRVMAWHQDQVIEKPAEAEVAGSTSFCRFAALSYGDKAYTIQPHPEFQADYVSDLIAMRRAILPDAVVTKALASLDQPLSSPAIADRIEQVFKHRARVP